MGYDVKKVKREVYYKFNVEGDVEKFKQKIGKVDILVRRVFGKDGAECMMPSCSGLSLSAAI